MSHRNGEGGIRKGALSFGRIEAVRRHRALSYCPGGHLSGMLIRHERKIEDQRGRDVGVCIENEGPKDVENDLGARECGYSGSTARRAESVAAVHITLRTYMNIGINQS